MRAHLTRLLELARKATPGERDPRVDTHHWPEGYQVEEPWPPFRFGWDGCEGIYVDKPEDWQLIAALSPELVAALVKVAQKSWDHFMTGREPTATQWDACEEALDELRRAVGGET